MFCLALFESFALLSRMGIAVLTAPVRHKPHQENSCVLKVGFPNGIFDHQAR